MRNIYWRGTVCASWLDFGEIGEKFVMRKLILWVQHYSEKSSDFSIKFIFNNCFINDNISPSWQNFYFTRELQSPFDEKFIFRPLRTRWEEKRWNNFWMKLITSKTNFFTLFYALLNLRERKKITWKIIKIVKSSRSHCIPASGRQKFV